MKFRKAIIKLLRYCNKNIETLCATELYPRKIKKIFNLRKQNIHYSRYLLFDKKFIKDYGISTVIDIGANIGEFTLIFHDLFPNATIYAFEPHPLCFAKLVAATHGCNRIKNYNLALGSKEGTSIFFKSSWDPASSIREMSELHKGNYPHSSKLEKIEVKVVSLDNILTNVSLKRHILIKMDIQGFEDEAIKGGMNILKNAKIVIIETSFKELYKDEPLFDGIYTLMRSLGFAYFGSLKQSIDKSDESFLQADCIFINQNI